MRPAITTLLGGAALVLGLAACGGPYYDYEGPPPGAQVIVQAPPQPVIEELPAMPYAGAVWAEGYWHWSGSRYLWVSGRWLRPPRLGLVWYTGGYVRWRGGYVWVAGRWAGMSYRPRYRYVHWRRYRKLQRMRYRRWKRHRRRHAEQPVADTPRGEWREPSPERVEVPRRRRTEAPHHSYRPRPAPPPSRVRVVAPPSRGPRAPARREAPPAEQAPSKRRSSAPAAP